MLGTLREAPVYKAFPQLSRGPNIFGNISDTYTGAAEAGSDGALYFVYPQGGRVTVTELGTPGPAHFALDASKSNALYASATLQPAACLCQVAIRF